MEIRRLPLFFASVRAGLGNSIIIDTQEKIFEDFKKLLFITAWVSTFCSACFLCLYQPFMEIWVGKEYLLEFGIVIWLVIYFYVHCINVFLNSYKDASGMWHEDRFRPLVEAATNLILNIILVRYIGLYGIIISTVFSMIFVAPWLIHNIFDLVLGQEHVLYFLKRIFYYIVAAAIVMFLCYKMCNVIHTTLFITMIVRSLICLLFGNVTYMVLCCRLPEYNQCILLIEKLLGKRFSVKQIKAKK